MTCKFAMDWGTNLDFKHHRLHFPHTQFHYLQSKVTKQYPQNFFRKLGTYWLYTGMYVVYTYMYQLKDMNVI
jgi:hypothetical protein